MWEYLKNFKGIREDELTWNKFERLFKKTYLLERYYGNRAKEFYELHMGSNTDDEYTSIFLELLTHVPYLKEEKEIVQRFISGLLLAYRDWIEFDEPRLLEEAIWKLKHSYVQLKHKVEHKRHLKGNKKVKGKWPPKQGIP